MNRFFVEVGEGCGVMWFPTLEAAAAAAARYERAGFFCLVGERIEL